MKVYRRARAEAALIVSGLFLLGCGDARSEPDHEVPTTDPPSVTATIPSGGEQDYINGRVTTFDGAVYEGRLRFGGDEEAFWSDHFNGMKGDNPWADHAPPDALRDRRPPEIFGVTLGFLSLQVNLGRPFVTRFGDIVRIEPFDRDLRVTLKSGTIVHLDRYAADDFGDGVRVWDAERGVVELDEGRIRSIEFPATFEPTEPVDRLHGSVRTREGEFSGFLQWDREEGVLSDELDGYEGERLRAIPFDSIASISRGAADRALVTLRDGRELVLSGHRNVGAGHRGIYVDDPRYGRVLVAWDSFERVDLSPGGSGPAYGDFLPGSPIRGIVTARDGRRIEGRIVHDLDESETTETLDAPSGGVDFMIPFGRIASILLPRPGNAATNARILLHDGGELELELAGDLDDGNVGPLIFQDGRERPDYLEWSEVERIDLEP